jgi:hypothetical protein
VRFGDEQERQLKAPIMQDKIQPFYNRFSYPLAESNSNVNGAKLFKILDREMQSKGFKGKTFPLMIVGCGSGHRCWMLPRLFLQPSFMNSTKRRYDIVGAKSVNVMFMRRVSNAQSDDTHV